MNINEGMVYHFINPLKKNIQEVYIMLQAKDVKIFQLSSKSCLMGINDEITEQFWIKYPNMFRLISKIEEARVDFVTKVQEKRSAKEILDCTDEYFKLAGLLLKKLLELRHQICEAEDILADDLEYDYDKKDFRKEKNKKNTDLGSTKIR